MKEILEYINDFGTWPPETTVSMKCQIIDGQYATEEDGEVNLTSLGELEIGCVETV